MAHLKYALLNVLKCYPDISSSNAINGNLMEAIEDITPDFYKSFAEKYSSKLDTPSICIYV